MCRAPDLAHCFRLFLRADLKGDVFDPIDTDGKRAIKLVRVLRESHLDYQFVCNFALRDIDRFFELEVDLDQFRID